MWACTPGVKKHRLEEGLPATVSLVGAAAALSWALEDGVTLSF